MREFCFCGRGGATGSPDTKAEQTLHWPTTSNLKLFSTLQVMVSNESTYRCSHVPLRWSLTIFIHAKSFIVPRSPFIPKPFPLRTSTANNHMTNDPNHLVKSRLDDSPNSRPRPLPQSHQRLSRLRPSIPHKINQCQHRVHQRKHLHNSSQRPHDPPSTCQAGIPM